MKLYEILYKTLTGRECRASVVAHDTKEALEVGLAELAREGVKVVTHDGACCTPIEKTFHVHPQLLRLDTN
jgi:hypothetical protein